MFSKSTFGTTPASTSFGFGSTNTNQNLFGQSSSLFGKPATTGFGSTNTTFGNPAPIFGSSSTPLFPSNASGTFGANQNQPAFGSTLFGNQQNANTGNLFGSNPSTFGQQNKPVGFGFSSTAPTNRLFSQTSTPQTPFQSTTSNSLFGQSTGFGSTPTGTVIKFNPVTGTDTMQKSGVATNINTKHHCITCMKDYEGKSLEELRWEDYQANRKGPQQQQGGFGVAPFGITPTSTAPSLFGQSSDNKTTFGQMGTFSQSSGFGLGTQTGQTGGLFGKPNSTFGTTTTSSSFGFNNTPASNPFSTNPTQPFAQSKPLFGTTNTQNSGFGGTNIFGQSGTQPAQSNMFGQTQASGFGLNSGFGQMQPNQGSIFQTSKPSTSFGPFSQTITSAPSFGQPSGTFGQSNAFNTFGKPTQSTFGNPQGSFGTSLGTQGNGSLFGNLQQKPGGFFGNTNSTGLFSGGTSFQPNTGFNLQQMQSQLNTLQPTLEQSEELKVQLQNAGTFGRSKVLIGFTPLKEDENKRTTNPRELKVILDSSVKVKLPSPLKNKPNITSVNSSRMDVFDVAVGKSKFDAKDYIKMTGKRLVIRKKGDTESRSNSLSDTSLFDFEGGEVTDSDNFTRKLQANKETLELNADASKSRISMKPVLKSNENVNNPPANLHWLNSNKIVDKVVDNLPTRNKYEGDVINDDPNYNDKRLEVDKENFREPENASKHPCGIILTRPEYYTCPSMDQLSQHLNDDGSCIVKGFTIGRVGYGNVYYPDAFDVANLNLDKIIFFRQGEIIVYPDESATPPVGQGLNRRAQVTLDKIWPKTKDGSIMLTDIKEINAINFVDKLQQICEKRSSKFVEYRPETGSWVFKVEHFSKHGLSDSDEEEVSEKVLKLRNKSANVQHRTAAKEDDDKLNGKYSPLEVATDKSKEVVQVHDKLLSRNLSDSLDVFQESITGLGGFQLGFPKSNTSVSSDDVTPLDKNEPFPSLRSSRHFIYKEVEASHVALMKTSFFDEKLHDVIDKNSDELTSDLIRLSVNAVADFQSEPKLVSVENRMKLTSLLPRTFELRNQSCVVSGENGFLHNHKNYKDMSVFLGRSFKVGWGRGNILTRVSHSYTYSYKVQFCNLSSLIQDDNNPFYRTLLNHFHVVKENSKLNVNSMGVPMFNVNSGFNILSDHQKLVSSDMKLNDFNSISFYYSCIWDLIIALWMPRGDLTRRDIFSNWLKRAVMYDVEKELYSQTKIDTGMKSVFNKIFTYLTGHRIDEAARLALKNNLPQLSLQISQLNSVGNVKRFSEIQFSQWNAIGAVKHIDEELLRIYTLITGITGHQTINISKNLDWKRALGLHLWYLIPVEQPISVVLKAYTKAFGELCYSKKPLPLHVDEVNYSNTDKYDILYHIISLFVYPYGGLHRVLEPITYTNNPLDYSLSWFLMNTFEALNIGNITQDTSSYVHISFSNQLESMGYWHWAIFVLLFLKDENTRQNMVIKILERHLTCDLTEEALEMEEYLVNEFNIPSIWIHTVKSRRAKYENKNWEAYGHMILSKQWISGHDFAISVLIPDLMTQNDFYLLEKVLQVLLPGHKSILEWKIKGGLLLDFIRLWKLINKPKSEIEESSLKAIEIDLLSLLARLNKFPITTNKQALCISECSKFITFLLKRFYLELHNKSFDNICKTSSYIQSLVLPPDYKQSELIKCLFNMITIQMI